MMGNMVRAMQIAIACSGNLKLTGPSVFIFEAQLQLLQYDANELE